MTEVKIIFASTRAAETALRGAGLSIGSRQGRSPRGILFGDYLIAKWRNLTMHERNALHGELLMHSDLDLVKAKIRADRVPPDALAFLQLAAESDERLKEAGMNDPEAAYGEIAVKCVLSDGRWRHLPWPAYAATAKIMAQRGDLDATNSVGRRVYRLPPKTPSDQTPHPPEPHP